MNKHFFGWVGTIIGFLAPIGDLIICAIVFVAIDFILGVWADIKVHKRKGQPFGFSSEKAWRTVEKLTFIIGGIILCYLLDSIIVPFFELKLANIFTGFVCGVEFWSYLENAAEISKHPVFLWVKKYMGDKFNDKLKKYGNDTE